MGMFQKGMFQEEGLRAVIFDIDNTLVDTFSVYWKVFNNGIGEYNMPPVAKDFLESLLKGGKSLREILERVFPPGTGDRTIDECKERIKVIFRQVEPEEVKLFPGVEELLEFLKNRGVKIGIATGRVSTPEDEWGRFGRLGLSRFIDAIVTSSEVSSRKPAPDVLLECAGRLGVNSGSCLAVGDTESDILAAKRAGMIAAYVRSGDAEEDAIAKAEPDIVLESILDLVALLEGERK